MTICTLARYRDITNDRVNYDGDVVTALVSAQKLVEQKTDRPFELRDADGEPIVRTERLKIHGNWLVYPRATPVQTVVTPVGAAVSTNAVWGAHVSLSAVDGLFWEHGTISYTGGYEPDEIPEEIVEAVAKIAFAKLPSSSSEIPLGATSVHVGDVSFTGKNLGQSLGIPDSVRSTLIKWKRREL